MIAAIATKVQASFAQFVRDLQRHDVAGACNVMTPAFWNALAGEINGELEISDRSISTADCQTGLRSLLPTLRIGQVVVSDNAPVRAHPPELGAIVVFHPPARADTPDAMRCATRGRSVVPPVRGPEGGRVSPDLHQAGGWVAARPHREYFVLGDNLPASDDGRFWGPVKRSWLIGLVKVSR